MEPGGSRRTNLACNCIPRLDRYYCDGIEEFKRYVDKIRAAFPDFHNHIEELIGEGEKVVARLTYTGSHQGELFGFPGTGKKISYQGVGIFQFREGKIVSGFVLGDTENLKRQIAQP